LGVSGAPVRQMSATGAFFFGTSGAGGYQERFRLWGLFRLAAGTAAFRACARGQGLAAAGRRHVP